MSPRSVIMLAACALLAAGRLQAAGTGYLFVSSEKDDDVMVLDGKTYEVVKTIDTSARPRHLQFNGDRTMIYVAAGEGNAIDVIDVAKLEVVDTIPGIEDPELFDISPDGNTLYISLEDDGALGILDLVAWRELVGDDADERLAERVLKGSGRVGDDEEKEEKEDEDKEKAGDRDEEGVPGMTVVEVGEEPEGVLAHPNGRFVYVTSEVSNIVHVVDVESRELVANIVVGKRPRRMALTPDLSELWVTNELGGSATIIDAKANKVLGTVEFKPSGFRAEQVTPVGITMTRDGAKAFVGLGRANHVAVVDVESRKVEGYVLVGERAWNTTLNRDESLLYVVNGLSDDISIVDVRARKAVKSVPVGRVPHTALIDD